ncbi:ulp1 protease family, C-terminal catalytic domain-containing protein [Tanacetum coccineum]
MNRPRLGPKGKVFRGSNYCLARAPHDKDGNTTLLLELADLSKDLTKASQQLSEGTIESKAMSYIRKKRTYQHRQEDYEEMEIRVLQKVKAVIKRIEFWEEIRVEMRRELESESNEGLSTWKDEFEFPRQSVASTTSIIKLSCIKEETYCCLYVPSSVSTHEKVTCATATIFPIGDDLIHGNKLLKGHMKVSSLSNKGLYTHGRFKAIARNLRYKILPGIEQGKGKVTAEEPTNKKKALEEPTKPKMALAKIAEQTKAKERGRSQQNKVGFLHPEMITPDVYGADKGVTLDYLARALEGYEFYVTPYLQGAHYVLFIIWPKHGRGFILDSQKESVFHTEDNYRLAGLVDSVLGGRLKWELPTANRQPSTWECGYYVMRWMHDFVLKYQNDDFPNTIPWGEERRLENKELDAVIGACFSLTGSEDGDVKLWNAKNAKLADVTDIQVVSNGFLSCGGDGTIKLVQLRDLL